MIGRRCHRRRCRLGERAMTWQLTDPAANRQGLTIAEFGELGGPGMGGCPNGPLQTGPPAPTTVAADLVSGGTDGPGELDPAVTVPGTPAITGYRVSAVDTPTPPRRNRAGRDRAADHRSPRRPPTITGLDPNITYRVEVVVGQCRRSHLPGCQGRGGHRCHCAALDGLPVGGSYAVAQQVTLSADEPGVDIYYTTDGTRPDRQCGRRGPTATLVHRAHRDRGHHHPEVRRVRPVRQRVGSWSPSVRDHRRSHRRRHHDHLGHAGPGAGHPAVGRSRSGCTAVQHPGYRVRAYTIGRVHHAGCRGRPERWRHQHDGHLELRSVMWTTG